MSNNTEFYLLKDAEARYRGMFENAVEGMYQSTPDGAIIWRSTRCARTHVMAMDPTRGTAGCAGVRYSEPDLRRSHFPRERFKEQIDRDGFVHDLEYQVRQRDGTIIWISESARAVRGEDGEVRFYEGFIDNITAPERKRSPNAPGSKTNASRRRKMDAVGTLAGGMAHDFNNMLCAILGYTEAFVV